MNDQERARTTRSGSVESDGGVVQVGDGMEVPAALARAIDLAKDRKGRDMLLLDLRGISNATDYFLLVTGTSDTHVKAVADHILEELREDGVKPMHIEGVRTGRWVLMDYIDFVIHVFHPAAREFYQLERLWGDAPSHAFPDES
ncbi:MAG TPA: ribosome silencing factor [Longimicrobiales bacterium]|nr:ribosome silencing factor [Longimicrobiales bacterium]